MAEMIKLMAAGADKVYREIGLPVLSLSIKRDESAADMLEVKLAGEIKDFPSFLSFYLEGELIFEGITDDLIVTQKDKTVFTELVARDMFSLLTDNELRPCSLRNPSLRLFAERFLAPLGFEAKGNMTAYRGEILIKEGCSVYRGLGDFCRSFMGTEPKRRGNIIYCGTERPALRFDEKYPVVRLERSVSRYGVASRVYEKSSTSALYTGWRDNTEDMGFTRWVYGEGKLSPAREKELTLAAGVDILPGDYYGDLLAESVKISFDGVSWQTRIKGKETEENVDKGKA